jgi:hypothetical protein
MRCDAKGTTSAGLRAEDAMQAPSRWGLPVYDRIKLLLRHHEMCPEHLLHPLHCIDQDRIPLLSEELLKYLYVRLYLAMLVQVQ